MSIELDEIEAGIVGCLIEKENATPDYYPLTLNALVNACNQKSNRDPVVNYDQETVESALESLLRENIIYLFYGSGSRTPKYKHLLPKILELNHPETAIICVLLLRGPQTLGELNQRTNRIYEFSNLGEVNQTVDSLINRDEVLILKLPKQPGQKEARFYHSLSGIPKTETIVNELEPTKDREGNDRIEMLEDEIMRLGEELIDFRREFEKFKSQFE